MEVTNTHLPDDFFLSYATQDYSTRLLRQRMKFPVSFTDLKSTMSQITWAKIKSVHSVKG